MDVFDLVIGIFPPAAAMLVQQWGIPTDRSIIQESDAFEATYGVKGIGKVVEHNLKGAVAVCGLNTTFISLPAGLFSVFHNLKGGLLFSAIGVLLCILLIIISIGFLGGVSLFDISSRNFKKPKLTVVSNLLPSKEVHSRSPFFEFGRLRAIRWLVNVLNLSLIVISFAVFFSQSPPT